MDAIASTQAQHDRGLPALAPGGTAVIIGPHPGRMREHHPGIHVRLCTLDGGMFDPEALPQSWLAAPTGKRGEPVLYSDGSIQTLVVLKQVFL
jgi:hypothetical protein